MPILLDTNVLLKNHIRNRLSLPVDSFISIINVGELESLALQLNWSYQKQTSLQNLLNQIPIIDINAQIAKTYGLVDAYSQGKLQNNPLPAGTSARNMGKNDIWLAATALFFRMDFQTYDNDFDHLVQYGLLLHKL
ncbi:MAG: type II toxin-antitoxin system VapC family toxin [Microscillaceae bacterium]|nr:type II toxin-antitoxin system VapC family toxin [Microscillaceae bacterium]